MTKNSTPWRSLLIAWLPLFACLGVYWWLGLIAACFAGVIWLQVVTGYLVQLHNETRPFEPYSLEVYFNPAKLFVHLGLLPSAVEGESWVQKVGPDIASKFQTREFDFTALGPKLFHCSTEGQKPYFEVLNVYQKIDGLKPDWKPAPFEAIGLENPAFFLRLAPGRQSYEYGIRVVKSWWTELKTEQNVAPELRRLEIMDDGALILGTFPVNIPFDENDHLEHEYLEIHQSTLESQNVPYREYA